MDDLERGCAKDCQAFRISAIHHINNFICQNTVCYFIDLILANVLLLTFCAMLSAMSVTTTTTTILRPFIWDYPAEMVPEETLITMINHPSSASANSILSVQSECLTVFCTTSLQVIHGLPLGLEPSNLYFIHFFTQSLSFSHNTRHMIRLSQHMPIPLQLNLL